MRNHLGNMWNTGSSTLDGAVHGAKAASRMVIPSGNQPGSILTCVLTVIGPLKETERKRSSCVVIRQGQSVLKTSSKTQGRHLTLQLRSRVVRSNSRRQHAVSHHRLRVHSDSAAARGMMTRRGSGRV